MDSKFKYRCAGCGREFPANNTIYLCPDCSAENKPTHPPKGVLKLIYLISKAFDFKQLKKNLWLDLLPIHSLNSLPNLNVGNTPLYKIEEFEDQNFNFDLYLKDDSQNPTYSFKDRASALVSAYAKEHNIQTIVAASTGNAGSSIAGICAAQGQKAIVMVPDSAPIAKLTQIVMYGARVIPVKGTYDDAFDLSVKATEHFGWYNRNTAFNPLTIEGKKIVSFELYDQLDETIPDRIFVPVGDGVIVSGVYKGFEDLLRLGIVDKIPTIVAVQAEGSDNLIRNISNSAFKVKESNTVADSISVDYPRNFYMTKDFIQKYNGETLIVSDKEIMEASKSLSKNTGLFAEPASAAAFAGLLKYKNIKNIPAGSKNVVLLTGSGLKDIASLQEEIKIPVAIKPDIKYLER
jgi:threonine synthase